MTYLYRIKYQKKGPLKFISQLDLNLLVRRILLRTKMPLELTMGYNPRIKISFGPALAVGLEGWQEIMEIFLREPLPKEEIQKLINEAAPSGFRVIEVVPVLNKSMPFSKLLQYASYLIYIKFVPHINEDKRIYYFDKIESIVENILRQEKINTIKKTKEGTKEVDLRPYIYKINILTKTNERIIVRLVIDIKSKGGISPYLFTNLLNDYFKGELSVEKIVREKFILNNTGCS